MGLRERRPSRCWWSIQMVGMGYGMCCMGRLCWSGIGDVVVDEWVCFVSPFWTLGRMECWDSGGVWLWVMPIAEWEWMRAYLTVSRVVLGRGVVLRYGAASRWKKRHWGSFRLSISEAVFCESRIVMSCCNGEESRIVGLERDVKMEGIVMFHFSLFCWREWREWEVERLSMQFEGGGRRGNPRRWESSCSPWYVVFPRGETVAPNPGDFGLTSHFFFEVCARCGDGSVSVFIISVEAVLVNEPFHCHCRRDKSVNSPLLCDDIGDEVWFCEPESVLLPQPGGSFFSNISGYLLFCWNATRVLRSCTTPKPSWFWRRL